MGFVKAVVLLKFHCIFFVMTVSWDVEDKENIYFKVTLFLKLTKCRPVMAYVWQPDM